MTTRKLRYWDFVNRIDIDALEAAIGFEPIDSIDGNDRGYCPLPLGLHKNGDTTGKFAIHRTKRVFSCWVCSGGSLLDLAMIQNDMDEEEATKWLYQFTTATDEDFSKKIADLFASTTAQEPPVLPYFNEMVLDKWITPSHHPWFKERGITKEVARLFKLGVNPLTLRASDKETYYGPTIVLPHFWKDRLVGWQNRWLNNHPKWIPKYTNTKSFPKRETLWGYDFVAQFDRPPIVVESVPTALFLLSHGHPAVATFGATVTEEQIKLLRVFQSGVILSPDNDKAGEKGADKLIEKLTKFIPVSLIQLPSDLEIGGDLGDFAKNPSLLRKYIEEATHV